jgi:hypothetical protein
MGHDCDISRRASIGSADIWRDCSPRTKNLLGLLPSLGDPTLRVAGILSENSVAIVKEMDGTMEARGVPIKLEYWNFPDVADIRAYSLIAKHVRGSAKGQSISNGGTAPEDSVPEQVNMEISWPHPAH